MTTQTLSNEVAYRIALASKTLPDTTVGDLIEVLHGCLEEVMEDKTVLDEDLLSKITVTNLKTALGQTYSLDGEEDGEGSSIPLPILKDAVSILWGEVTEVPSHIPTVDPYTEGDMPNSVRIAVASNADETLDGHFGSCLRYLIYQLSEDEIRLVDVRSAEGADESDDKNGFRVNLIKDCQVIYLVSVGGPAAAKVIKAGLYPMKILEGGEARTILGQLQQVMLTSPPPWLAKILGTDAKDRVKNYKAAEVS
ncbi:MAG: dinitrogenase iron-molybdenum cofactor biosynthesis protein [Microcystaceae cyanobacterium]